MIVSIIRTAKIHVHHQMMGVFQASPNTILDVRKNMTLIKKYSMSQMEKNPECKGITAINTGSNYIRFRHQHIEVRWPKNPAVLPA